MSLSQNTCCICMKAKCLTEISQNDLNNVPILSKLQSIVPEIEWSPECKICQKCLETVGNFADFKKLCIETHLKLKKAEKTNIIKLEETPIQNNIKGEATLKNEAKNLSGDEFSNQFDSKWSSDDNSDEKHLKKQTYKCPFCNIDFPTQFKLKKHKKTCFKQELGTKSEVKVFKKRYYCKQHCQLAFSDITKLEQHQKTCQGVLHCKNIIAKFDDSIYGCEKCARRFTSEQVLSAHARECNGASQDKSEVKSKCPLCFTVYLNQNALKIHFSITHNLDVDAVNMCQVCHEQFDSAQGLCTHAHAQDVAQVTLECEHCFQSYCSVSELSAHLFEQHKVIWEGEASCEVCCEVLRSEKAAVRHYARVHDISGHLLVRAYLCPHCPSRFNKSTLKAHVKDHLKPRLRSKKASDTVKYVCEICNQAFVAGNQLKIHCLKEHNPEKKISVYAYSCRHCETKATSLDGLYKHMRSHHLKAHNMVPNADKPKINCEVCHEEFETSTQVIEHSTQIHNMEVASVTPYGCPHCPRRYSALQTFQEHISLYFKTEDKQRFVCPTCGADFAYKLTLREHEDAVHKNIEYICDLCGKKFNKKCYLTIHVRAHHPHLLPPEKLFKCTHCDRTFGIKDDLTKHLNRVNGIKNYPCLSCAMRFVTVQELRTHARQHSSDRTPKYECTECHRFFQDKCYMKYHMKKEHNLGNAKFVPRHLKTRNHSCNLCPKDFITKRDLERHLNSHAGIKPYSCSICSKLYAKQQNLKSHMLKEHNFKQ